MLKSKIDTNKLINEIRLNCSDYSWVGIKIKGTNLIIELTMATDKPVIIDENNKCSIISNKKGIISKINVQSGTALVKEGDEVEEGTMLVDGVMEGKYTGKRYVNSRADIYAFVTYSKEESKKLNVIEKHPTGNEICQFRIKFNKFKINLNKGVSKFKNYDTIETKNRLCIFSNYYLPIEFEKIIYKEYKKEIKKYTVEEITKELETKLKQDILLSLDENQEFIEETSEVKLNGEVVTVKVNCKIEEKIGVIQDLVF